MDEEVFHKSGLGQKRRYIRMYVCDMKVVSKDMQ